MKGPWIVLAIVICAVALPASAQHEPPSHDDRGSGDVGHGDGGHNDAGHGDSGGHDSPADSSPSSGGDSGHHDSGDTGGSSDPSPSGSDPSWSGNDSYSHDGPDAGRDSSGGASWQRGEDWEPPPRARPRDPGSVEPPPTGAQQRHPRPEADDGGFPNPPETGGGLWDDEDRLGPWHGHSEFDYDGRYGYARDYARNRSRRGGAVRLVVEPYRAAVYVDGHYAGIARDFSGAPHSLFLSPGIHEIALVLDGYTTLRVYVRATADQVIDVRGTLDPAGPP